MVWRISILTVFFSITLAALSSRCVAQTVKTQGVDAACGSSQLAAAADSVAASFDKHGFVFISSTHGSKKPHDFLMCLLSQPAFQQRVTDILVEWANPVHQSEIDRYLFHIEQVRVRSLR